MVGRGIIRRMFPGGNTSRGFRSYYEFIAPPDSGYTFVLKGGPGTGKSTFMKRIAADLLALGVDTEFHHCSADPASVDAVAFPRLGVAIVDGTAPHVVEPTDYETGGEIIHLGKFCNSTPIRRQKARIETLRRDARSAFARAYKYLAAARHVRGDWTETNRARRDENRLGKETVRLMDAVFLPTAAPTPAMGRWPSAFRRRLFAGSITPEGPRHHLDTIVASMQKVYVVRGEPGMGPSSVIRAVADGAVTRGFAVEQYHCPFDPDNVDHVLIPALHTAVVSSGPLFPYAASPTDIIVDLNGASGVNRAKGTNTMTLVLDRHNEPEAIAIARQTFWQLLRIAIRSLQEAKSAHMALEGCYAPHVNFDGLEQLRREIRDRIVAFHRRTVAFDSL